MSIELDYVNLRLFSDKRARVTLHSKQGKPYPAVLQELIHEALAAPETDYVLSIDADNPPILDYGPDDFRSPFDDLQHDKDVISFPTLLFRLRPDGESPWMYNVFEFEEETQRLRVPQKTSGLQRYHQVGGGCLLTARRVFEKIEGPFVPTFYPDGTQREGPDVAFSRRCREAGFELWADWDRRCKHYTTVEAEACVRAMDRAVERTVRKILTRAKLHGKSVEDLAKEWTPKSSSTDSSPTPAMAS
jgi:hypothetical protein